MIKRRPATQDLLFQYLRPRLVASQPLMTEEMICDAATPEPAEVKVRSRLKRTVVGLFRVAVSLGLLCIIFYKVGLATALERVVQVDWSALALASALILLTIAFHAKRWLIVVSMRGYSWRFRSALRETWIGYFFNQLLPSSVGGDGVRALRLYQSGIPVVIALRAVLTERIFGFIACTLLGVLAVPVMVSLAPSSPATIAVGLIVVMGLLGILFLLRGDLRVLSFLPVRIKNEIRQLSDALHNKTLSRWALAVSFAMQFLIAATVAVLSTGLGLSVHPILVAVLFQPVTLITLVPITLAGWGIREGALVAVLAAIGVSSEDALPLSLCFGTIVLFASVPGGLLLAAGKAVAPQRPASMPAPNNND